MNAINFYWFDGVVFWSLIFEDIEENIFIVKDSLKEDLPEGSN